MSFRCGMMGRHMFALRCVWKRIQVSQKVNIIFVHFEPVQKDATISNIKLHEYSTSDLGVVVYIYMRVGTLIVATIYLQLIQNRYMFRSFTVLHCSHQHCVQPVASDVEVVGYL